MPLTRILEPEVMDSADDAADYDAMDHREVNRVFVDDLLAALSAVPSPAPSPQPLAPLDLLDLGTGTAQIPIEFCSRYPACRVMAVYAAVSMLDVARYNVEAASLIERIELRHTDAKALPFADAMFDVVMSNSIVHHIPQPGDVLREAVRVAKTGGLLFVRDLLRPDSEQQLDNLVATYAAGCNDHQRKLFADSLQAALSLDEIRESVASLGFDRATVQATSDRHWTWSAANPH